MASQPDTLQRLRLCAECCPAQEPLDLAANSNEGDFEGRGEVDACSCFSSTDQPTADVVNEPGLDAMQIASSASSTAGTTRQFSQKRCWMPPDDFVDGVEPQPETLSSVKQEVGGVADAESEREGAALQQTANSGVLSKCCRWLPSLSCFGGAAVRVAPERKV